jgi:hypothetical protein
MEMNNETASELDLALVTEASFELVREDELDEAMFACCCSSCCCCCCTDSTISS